MCLRPEPIPPVPAETARVARLAFPRGNPYLTMRDAFGALFQDEQFAALFPRSGQPAHAPWRLALVTLLQFAEGLSDRQAAAAVRRCIDWKYLLGLELTDPGFDFSLLCEFRARLVAGAAELLLFETLLRLFRERQLLKARGKQRTDATHVLAAVGMLNRLETVGETMRQALNALAVVAPEWLQTHSRSEWVERYERGWGEQRRPQTPAEREALATTIGADGFWLLEAIAAQEALAWLRQVPAVEILRQVWVQQYYREERAGGWLLRWRTDKELPPTPQRIVSPADPEARWGTKRSTNWVGYKVHLTETCEAESPLLITDVQTSAPLTVDSEVLPQIHQALQGRALLPATHLVDGGYMDAGVLAESPEQYAVAMVGPAPGDTAWQAREGQGFAARDFTVCWKGEYVLCPRGRQSMAWSPKRNRGQPVIEVRFSQSDCGVCPSREQCTRARDVGRHLTLKPEREHRALEAARQRQQRPEFGAAYAARAGVEGSVSQGVRVCGLRRSRYVGQAKTHLQHLLIATALNFLRVAHWLMGDKRTKTRRDAFARVLAVG